MWIMNIGKPINMPQLNEAMAIDLGSQILGEAVIFLSAAFLLCIEYSRQVYKEEQKENMAKDELHKLDDKIQQLKEQLSWQTSTIQNLVFSIQEINSTQKPLNETKTNKKLFLIDKSNGKLSAIDSNNIKLVDVNQVSETPHKLSAQSYSDSVDYHSVLSTMP